MSFEVRDNPGPLSVKDVVKLSRIECVMEERPPQALDRSVSWKMQSKEQHRTTEQGAYRRLEVDRQLRLQVH